MDQKHRVAAAREAKAQYVEELFVAGMNGDDTDREANDWLYRLTELVGPFVGMDESVDGWYELERQRLNKMIEIQISKPAICSSGVVTEMRPNGISGTILINGIGYAVSIIGKLPLASAKPIIYGYRFTKEDGTIYDVCRRQNHLQCDCPDFLYRCVNVDRNGCKHCQAVRRHFALPVELDF